VKVSRNGEHRSEIFRKMIRVNAERRKPVSEAVIKIQNNTITVVGESKS